MSFETRKRPQHKSLMLRKFFTVDSHKRAFLGHTPQKDKKSNRINTRIRITRVYFLLTPTLADTVLSNNWSDIGRIRIHRQQNLNATQRSQCGELEFLIPVDVPFDEVFLANYYCDKCDDATLPAIEPMTEA